MKKVLLFFLIVIVSNFARADYGYMSLSQLICDADYSIIGTIAKLDGNYFYIKVDSVLMGNVEKDTVAIIRFNDWPCAQRYSEYSIGQREIVFFRKSNYVIDDYEFLGYGAGDEFELPITNDSTVNYQVNYGELKPYNLLEFIIAVKNYSDLKQKVAGTSNSISKEVQMQFSDKSSLHKMFIECKKRNNYPQDYEEDEMPKMGVIADIEKRFCIRIMITK